MSQPLDRLISLLEQLKNSPTCLWRETDSRVAHANEQLIACQLGR